jgi:hypothetical protein
VVTICGSGGAVERSQDRLALRAQAPGSDCRRDTKVETWRRDDGLALRLSDPRRGNESPRPLACLSRQYGQNSKGQDSATAQCDCVVFRSTMSGKGMPAIPRPQGTRASANTSGPDSKLARRPSVELRSPYSRRRTERRKLVSSAGPDFDERARES